MSGGDEKLVETRETERRQERPPSRLPRVGDRASFSKTVTETDVVLFAGLTGDLNHIHIDATAAAESFFKRRVAHGMLIAGLISTVLGTRLPGPGTIYLRQDLKFMAPVFIGDTVTATVQVTRVIDDKRRVVLATSCTNQDGKTVLEGEALVWLPAE